MTPLERIKAEGFNAGIEAAAKIAEPEYACHRKKEGAWRVRRIDIACAIRACKIEITGAV